MEYHTDGKRTSFRTSTVQYYSTLYPQCVGDSRPCLSLTRWSEYESGVRHHTFRPIMPFTPGFMTRASAARLVLSDGAVVAIPLRPSTSCTRARLARQRLVVLFGHLFCIDVGARSGDSISEREREAFCSLAQGRADCTSSPACRPDTGRWPALAATRCACGLYCMYVCTVLYSVEPSRPLSMSWCLPGGRKEKPSILSLRAITHLDSSTQSARTALRLFSCVRSRT